MLTIPTREWSTRLAYGGLFVLFGTIATAFAISSRDTSKSKRDDHSEYIQSRDLQKRRLSQDFASKTLIRNYQDLNIVPLPDFRWEEAEPRKYRPYKTKYNLTMSIENANVSELLEMDKNYVNRVMLRRRLLAQHPDTVLGAYDAAKPAVDEFYSWLVTSYLPSRFRRMFELRYNAARGTEELWNAATSEFFPCTPMSSPEDTLRRMGGLIEDDLLFLLPADDGDGYVLKAFVTCFPNGFNTKKKLGLKLRDIHKPVPGYKEKLEKSMDRWFGRLTAGTFVRRYNWTITPHSELFTASGNHLYEGEKADQIDVDVERACVRSERQMVHRLPQSEAILFSFKTYLYPLTEIKEEGSGLILADAIDGLQSGNVPGMHFYKKAAVWGASVQRYLRS